MSLEETLRPRIEQAFVNRKLLADPDHQYAVEGTITALDRGELRVASPPQAELSKAEKPPIMRKRWGVMRKLAVYVGIPVAALVGVGALVAVGIDRQLSDPPTANLMTGEAARDPRLGNLCEGRIPVQVSVVTGRPPFEAIFTLQRVGGLREARVEGLADSLKDLRRQEVLRRPVLCQARRQEASDGDQGSADPVHEPIDGRRVAPCQVRLVLSLANIVNRN